MDGRLRIRLLAQLRLAHYLILLVVPLGVAVDLCVVVPGPRAILSNDTAVVVFLPFVVVEHPLENHECLIKSISYEFESI